MLESVPSPATKVIVISMTNALDRRHRFEERAKGSPIAWEFFDAFTSLHPSLSYDETNAILSKGRPLFKGELGCYSSHYAAWEQLVASEYDQYIVLEDDIIADWRFLAALADVKLSELNYRYIRLYFKRPSRQTTIHYEFIERTRRIVDIFGSGLGTQGYIITKAGALALLAHCKTVRRPIDDEMDRAWVHGVRNLSVFPFPIIEEFSASLIGGARFERFKIPGKLKLKRHFVRRVEKAHAFLAGAKYYLKY